MPRRCIINNCLTKGCVSTKSMYKFPKDEELCLKWLEIIKNPKLKEIYECEGVHPLNKRVFVCSDHFEPRWMRDVNDASQGLFAGAIPSVNLNLSMETLLDKLKKGKIHKDGDCSKNVTRVIDAFGGNQETDTNSSTSERNTANVHNSNSESNAGALGVPALSHLEEPLDTLSAKDENLISLIRKRKAEEPLKSGAPCNKNVHMKKLEYKKKKVLSKKLNLRVKGTDKTISIIVAPKLETSALHSSQQIIRVAVPKNRGDGVCGNTCIKVVIPHSIDGKQVQMDRSEISKIVNMVSRRNLNKRVGADDDLHKHTLRKCNKKAGTCQFQSRQQSGRQNTSNATPLKNIYRKTSETNKNIRHFIESHFNDIVKCTVCDFTPQDDVIAMGQRVVALKKKLSNTQKLLSKYKINNRKISQSIEQLRKQIPEKPTKPRQKGRLIKSIVPRNRPEETNGRGNHRFTKTLKSFSVDLFYSSPLSYSILEKIYLLPSRKTLKRWLVHSQHHHSDAGVLPGEHLSTDVNDPPAQLEAMNPLDSIFYTLDGSLCTVMRPNEMPTPTRIHLQPDEIHDTLVLEETMEPLQDSNYEMIFRSDIAEAIMNT